MKKVMLIFGTRPEAIKMAPLVKALQAETGSFQTVVCVTGQHREMLDQVLQIFHIKPDYDLNVMKPGQDLYDVTASILLKMRDVLQTEKPDMVLVHGDTTTSMAAALAAFYQQIPVGHVEAGLRTHNVCSPWPEEMNRQLTARMSAIHFAPTALCKDNLLKEGVSEENIYVTGNTVIDALHLIVSQCGISLSKPSSKRMVLITGHRRENFGEGMKHICQAIKTLAERFPEVDFIYPVHPNPNVRHAVAEFLDVDGNAHTSYPNIHLVKPMNYVDFVGTLAQSTLVLTDSGGIQEEAPGLGKPVLVMRNTTERQEAVAAGTVKLVGTYSQRIVDEVETLLLNPEAYKKMSQAINPYGDGRACERIVKVLKQRLNGK